MICHRKERLAGYHKKSRAGWRQNQTYHRKWKLKNKYGMTMEQFEDMADAQGGVCAICLGNNDGRILVIDHDHGTGAVRGLLCDNCNFMIGNGKNSVENLRAAITYLQAHDLSMSVNMEAVA